MKTDPDIELARGEVAPNRDRNPALDRVLETIAQRRKQFHPETYSVPVKRGEVINRASKSHLLRWSGILIAHDNFPLPRNYILIGHDDAVPPRPATRLEVFPFLVLAQAPKSRETLRSNQLKQPRQNTGRIFGPCRRVED